MPIFTSAELKKVSEDIFLAAGASKDEAGIVSEHLIEANLVGHDSHGVIRIPQYMKLIEDGLLNPGAPLEIENETPATAVVNGNWGFGQVIAQKAMSLAIEKAGKCPIASVGAHNCNHIGRLASYVMMAAEQDMVGMLFVNGCGAAQSVAPWGGTGRRLATNPMAFAFPTGAGESVVLDITSSVVAEGKVRVKRNRGEQTPEGWLIDSEGNPTTNPMDFYGTPPGALLPMGGIVGHKGYGLSLVNDILAGALGGAGCSRPNPGRMGNGAFMVVIDIEKFTPIAEFSERVDALVNHVKTSPTAPGFSEILVPGELEAREKKKRLREGIFVGDETWNQISAITEKLGVDSK